MCMYMHVFIFVCNSLLASITKIQLILISYLIQCSGSCSKHMGEEFVRGTVEKGGKVLISVLTKISVQMWTEFVRLWRGKAGSLLWLWLYT